MARWVTIKPESFPFDYKVPGVGVMVHFKHDANDPEDKGERYVTNDQAEFIIARGYGTAGKRRGSAARSRKGKTQRIKAVKSGENAATADNGPVDQLDDANLAHADSSGDRSGVDQAAG